MQLAITLVWLHSVVILTLWTLTDKNKKRRTSALRERAVICHLMQAELYHRSRANCARVQRCVKQHRNKQRKIERNYNWKTSWLPWFTFLAQRSVTFPSKLNSGFHYFLGQKLLKVFDRSGLYRVIKKRGVGSLKYLEENWSTLIVSWFLRFLYFLRD